MDLSEEEKAEAEAEAVAAIEAMRLRTAPKTDKARKEALAIAAGVAAVKEAAREEDNYRLELQQAAEQREVAEAEIKRKKEIEEKKKKVVEKERVKKEREATEEQTRKEREKSMAAKASKRHGPSLRVSGGDGAVGGYGSYHSPPTAILQRTPPGGGGEAAGAAPYEGGYAQARHSPSDSKSPAEMGEGSGSCSAAEGGEEEALRERQQLNAFMEEAGCAPDGHSRDYDDDHHHHHQAGEPSCGSSGGLLRERGAFPALGASEEETGFGFDGGVVRKEEAFPALGSPAKKRQSGCGGHCGGGSSSSSSSKSKSKEEKDGGAEPNTRDFGGSVFGT
mmetsp:Transcript_22112/g.43545  ORF Transcript_22112/g.43545 Transcript_22112/m.43545 type:complete len:335 (+) Transcript_22112:76-1080(+)